MNLFLYFLPRKYPQVRHLSFLTIYTFRAFDFVGCSVGDVFGLSSFLMHFGLPFGSLLIFVGSVCRNQKSYQPANPPASQPASQPTRQPANQTGACVLYKENLPFSSFWRGSRPWGLLQTSCFATSITEYCFFGCAGLHVSMSSRRRFTIIFLSPA